MAAKIVDDRKPVEEKRLANGMVLGLYDQSLRLAGDRWLVKLRGEVRIAVAPDFFSHEDDPELLAVIRERLGSELVFTIDRERYFIAEEQKEAVMAELLTRIQENVFIYLNNPSFPRKLFEKQYAELKRQVLLERRIGASRQEEERSGLAGL